MANEAVLRYSSGNAGDIQDYTVADGTAISKGALLELQDARTAIAVSGAGKPIAGIAARDKIANDGRTRLSVIRRGDFDMVASGAIAIGSPVCASDANTSNVKTVVGVGGISGAAIIGYALETASDGEVIQVRVNL
jgi:hypothetical protein